MSKVYLFSEQAEKHDTKNYEKMFCTNIVNSNLI